MSAPLFQDFDPRIIPWQAKATQSYENFNYADGIYEQFFSGSIGSAKTIEHIHLIVRHCLENNGARYLMVRRALKDLKRTSWKVLMEHIADIPHAIESYNKTDMILTFRNGSEILGDSYDKGDLEKFRSLELTGADFEEINECDKEVYEAIKMRVGRVPSVKCNIITSRCNPDEPSHWLYKYFIQDTNHKNKEVHYSLTEQNPFLPKWYIENLRADLDPQMVKRMLRGMWISIVGEGPYYAYDGSKQFLKDTEYKIDPRYSLDLFHDFNIGFEKPMSAGYGQYIDGIFHAARVFAIDGFNTEEIIDEMIDTGVFEEVFKVRVFGDCNGGNKDTRSKKSDYSIIQKKLQNYRKKDGSILTVEMQVPKSNPPIRERQNVVNAQCMNDLGQIRTIIYKDAETLDEGLRLTKVKKGSSYQEDDSLRSQHITSAWGYYLHRVKKKLEATAKGRIIIR
jgi:hypothetical protein